LKLVATDGSFGHEDMLGSGSGFGPMAMMNANERLAEGIEQLRVRLEAERAREEAIQAAEERQAAMEAARAAMLGPDEEAGEFDMAAEAVRIAVADNKAKPAAEAASEDKTEEKEAPLEDEDDDGDELARIRAARLAELRRRKEAAARSGGELREITEEEFLPSVTGTKLAVCLFTHSDFKPKCDVLIKHMRDAARLLPSTKFVSIDVERAPFFVSKLKIRVIPTTVFFVSGRSTSRMHGYDGLDLTTDGLNFSLTSVSAQSPDGCLARVRQLGLLLDRTNDVPRS
jgi:hypothetical protein